MKLYLFIFLTLLVLGGCDESSYHNRLKLLPPHRVSTISPDSLAPMLEKQQVVLLDARTAAEQEVSQLPGAKAIDYETFAIHQINTLPKDGPVVIYCAVGYRSGEVGEMLLSAGYTQVHNLYGGILEWKNKGYPVVTPAGAPTEKVHTYSSYWAPYLERGEAVY